MTKSNSQTAMNVNIFQVFHDESARQRLDPGFTGLDSAASPKPEWGEYWAIRNFFLTSSLNEDDLYGFFPSDFASKTALSAGDVDAFIRSNPEYDAYTFSPSIQDSACYLNVFEQGNSLYPGFIEAAEAYLQAIQLDVDLRTLPMDFRSTVYCNHIVAKPSFWQTWFALTEKLFDLFEGEDARFRERLGAEVACRPPMGMQALLVERIASLVLTLCPDIKVCAFDIRSMPLSEPAFRTYERQLSFLDNLKQGASGTADSRWLNNFYALRGAVLQACNGQRMSRAKDGFLGTPLKTSGDILYACFTHVPLVFDYPPLVSTFSLGGAQGPGKANLRDLAPEWEPYHPQLGAVAGSFALKNYIVENQLQLRHVGICQYRKFVSTQPIAKVANNEPRIADSWNCEALDDIELGSFMAMGDQDFLLVRPSVLKGGYFNQYKDFHVAEDFLRFTSEAVELGVLSGNDVIPFFNSYVFMLGGVELGVFPADFWVRTISAIEKVVRACFTRYPGRRSGYQVRNWAFCAERLGSYLLLNHLNSNYDPKTWQQEFVGQLNVVTGNRQTAQIA